MSLQTEVRHKSEDIADDVLLDVVKAFRRRVRVVNREYDILYIAGYSVDGQKVFIDRHLPRTFRWLMKTVRVEPFLLTHEIVEKALLDELRLHYPDVPLYEPCVFAMASRMYAFRSPPAAWSKSSPENPSSFASSRHSATVVSSSSGITKMQIQMVDQMMDAWEEQIKSPNPMTAPSAVTKH